MVTTKVNGNEIIVTIKPEAKGSRRESSTGKSFIAASTGGYTGIDFNGEQLKLMLNVIEKK